MCNNKKFNKKLKPLQRPLQRPVEKLQRPLQRPVEKLQRPLQWPVEKLQRPLQWPFKKQKTRVLPPYSYELDIIKCKKNLAVFPKGYGGILIGYYKTRIEDNQNKLDTAHAYPIEVSSPSYL